MEQLSSTHVVIQTTRSNSIQSFCTKLLIRCHHHHVPPNLFALLDTPLLREPTCLPPLTLILYSDRTVQYRLQQYSHPTWHVSNHYKPPNKTPPHDLYGYAPMELDAVHHKRKFTKGRNNKKRKVLKCYACGKLGHIVKDYHSKNKVH